MSSNESDALKRLRRRAELREAQNAKLRAGVETDYEQALAEQVTENEAQERRSAFTVVLGGSLTGE